MTYEERVEQSRTHIVKAVFPNTTNHYDTLFGGNALQWMDEVAFIAATRFSRQKMVTVSSDPIDFNHPIHAGTLVELVGEIVKVGSSSLKVNVKVYMEEMYSDVRELAIEGHFTLVAIDDDKRPVKILM